MALENTQAAFRTPSDVPPPLAYVSAAPARRERRLEGAITALAVGIGLLCIAFYAARYVMISLMTAQGIAAAEAHRGNWDAIQAFIMGFAGICTIFALIFLGVGLAWLRSITRADD
jgi:hypothetical protein